MDKGLNLSYNRWTDLLLIISIYKPFEASEDGKPERCEQRSVPVLHETTVEECIRFQS